MEVSRIIAEIDAQISKLQQARELLQGSGGSSEPKPGRGRPRKNATPDASSAATKSAATGKRKKRNLSEEARQRIAEAQKRRWAEKRGTAA